MDWLRVLSLFLWIAPHVLLGVLAAVIFKRRLYRDFPWFFAFVCYEIAEFLLMLILHNITSVTNKQYAYAYYSTLLVSIVLVFGVIDEVSSTLFRDSPFLRFGARRVLQCVTGLLLATGILLAIWAPGDNSVKWIAGVSVVSRGAAFVQCGLVVSLLLLSRILGLLWRRPALGIALGLGVLTSVELGIRAVRAEFSGDTWLPYLDLVATGSFLACVLIWLGYSVASEVEPAPLAAIPHGEVETWNTELQRLLRH